MHSALATQPELLFYPVVLVPQGYSGSLLSHSDFFKILSLVLICVRLFSPHYSPLYLDPLGGWTLLSFDTNQSTV